MNATDKVVVGRGGGRSPRGLDPWLDPSRTKEIETHLAAARRQEGRLLRRLGQQALDALAQEGRLDLQDAQARVLMEDLLRTHRRMALLEDRLRSLQAEPTDHHDFLPPPPGTDHAFPFSRR